MNDIFNFLNKLSDCVEINPSHTIFIPCKENVSIGDSMILLETSSSSSNAVLFGYALIDGKAMYVGVDPRAYLIDLDINNIIKCGNLSISTNEITDYSIKMISTGAILLKLHDVG
jgi:hypothetical protein